MSEANLFPIILWNLESFPLVSHNLHKIRDAIFNRYLNIVTFLNWWIWGMLVIFSQRSHAYNLQWNSICVLKITSSYLINTMTSICLSYRLIFTFNEPHACFDNEIQDTAAKSLVVYWLFETLWTVACQTPLYMGILQAGILECVAMPFSRGSSQPRDGTHISYVSWIGRHVLYHQCHLGSLYPRQENSLKRKGQKGICNFLS